MAFCLGLRATPTRAGASLQGARAPCCLPREPKNGYPTCELKRVATSHDSARDRRSSSCVSVTSRRLDATKGLSRNGTKLGIFSDRELDRIFVQLFGHDGGGRDKAHAADKGSHFRSSSLAGSHWSGRQDSNLRPPHPQCDALPGCATSRASGAAPISAGAGQGKRGRPGLPIASPDLCC